MAWWAERQIQARPRTIFPFPRRLEVRAESARRVELVAPRVSETQSKLVESILDLGGTRSCVIELEEPGVIKASEGLDVASRLAITINGTSLSGSVAIEGIPLEAEPASRSIAEKQTGSRKQGDAREDPGDDEELTLAKRLAYLLQPPPETLLKAEGPIEWRHDFFPYQRAGIQALIGSTQLLLADDMGLGKTVQAVAALRILFRLRRIQVALLVLPAGLVSQWRREIRQWAPELRISTISGSPTERAWQWRAEAHVYFVSYETLRADFTENPASPPRRRVWDVVLLDEAQKIKNPDAEVSRKCKHLQRRRAWALTGTPLENREEDLASLCEFVTPWIEGEPLERLTPGVELRSRHAALQLRRKKEDVLAELPPKTTVEITLQLTPAQRASYDRAEREGVMHLRELGRTVRITHVLELIQRLKQIANFCPETGESAKLDDVSSRLEVLADEGHRALIFSQYVDEAHGARAIAARLQDFRPLVYTGDLSSTDRDRVIREFMSSPERKALVLSLRAGGQGLNLQEASYVFHFDRWWNPAVERQAEDRTHRLGQTLPVTVYKYLSEGTIEERIDAVLRKKQDLFDQLVDDVTIDLNKRLTQDELFGLFGLEAPEPAPRRAQEERGPGAMSGEEFERYLADLLRRLGWKVELTPRSRDGGVDLIATKADIIGVEERLLIQCKNQATPVGVEVVREMQGILEGTAKGVVASPSGFTADAKAFAATRGLQLWDGDHIAKLSDLGPQGGVGDPEDAQGRRLSDRS